VPGVRRGVPVGAGAAGRLDRDLRAPRRRFITEISGEGILIAAAATIAFTVVAKAALPGTYVTIGLLAFAMGVRNDTIGRLSVQTNLMTTVPTSALTGLASDFALGAGSTVLARRRLTSLFSLLAGALPGPTLYLHYRTALRLAVTATAGLISVTVSARTAGSHILDR